MSTTKFNGKVALVTGGGRGIGKACAMSFAQQGARVVVADIDEENGRSVVEQIKKAGGDTIFLTVDVSDPETVEKMVRDSVEAFGQLDIAINNAGISGAQSETGEYKIEDWLKVIDINLNGVFYCMRYEITQMVKQGAGAIVNLSSILGTRALEKSAAYTTAKHGVVGLTKTAAIEYGKRGIRVNAVAPGFIQTPMVAAGSLEEEALEGIKAQHALGRLGKPEEVAALITFLCSDDASFMTGGYYPVDGGYLAG